ncbi:enoyl-CoA hydratase/isomerase family protein [Streptomyces goshikiensis]|uniref:enoyl-CoA hydratase/isomerase family protein n=1 Tax=Streptomyces goshikiensis TaxID=1942 RepID=UPI0036BFAE0E
MHHEAYATPRVSLEGGIARVTLDNPPVNVLDVAAVLGAHLYDAETAERCGWVNRAVPAAELDGVVDRLARDIAALPEGVIAAAKRALAPEDLSEGLRREHDAWAGQFARPAAERLIRGALARGAQTRDGERELEGLLRGLAG